MTNKEGEYHEPPCDPRLAKLLAMHLVSQVLDEAYVIANAAKDTGQPWRQMSMLRNFNSGRLSESDDADESLCVSKGDTGAVNENKMDAVANIVATSTPQKVAGEHRRPKTDTSFIGQGDEDLDVHQAELTKSTSMFLNHLFDMSDVEKVVICDDNDIVDSYPEPNDLLTQAMTKIMESYINTALGVVYDQNVRLDNTEVQIETSSTVHSEYSFLDDAIALDIEGHMACYLHDDVNAEGDQRFGALELTSTAVKITEVEEQNPEEMIEKLDVARFEQAFLTLNRDYDQCSEDDADPILQDPKGMTLQEVELMTANTSDDDVSILPDPEGDKKCEKPKDLFATSAVSAGASGSRKSSLVRRCRTQGARLLACLRGWWRRKTPGKRKEARFPGSVRGMCPMSPDARRRTASLLDQRKLRSPSPSAPAVWKFNTVSEALLNSNRWKEYTFDTKPVESTEY